MATAVRMATPSTHSNLLVDPGRNVWYKPRAREVTAAILRRIYVSERIEWDQPGLCHEGRST